MLSGVRRSLERLTRGIIGTRRRKGTTLYVVQYCSKTLRGGEGELQKPSLVSMIQQRMCESHLFPTMHVFWDVPGYVPTCLVRERNVEMGISLRSVIRVMSHDVAFVFMVGPRTAEPGHI